MMPRHFLAALIGLTLSTAAVAQSTSNQAPDWKQTLGGLLNGNQDRDDALRQAYERGYQRGRTDEARLQQSREPRGYDDNRAPSRNNYNSR